jgi:hypothetical protein
MFAPKTYNFTSHRLRRNSDLVTRAPHASRVGSPVAQNNKGSLLLKEWLYASCVYRYSAQGLYILLHAVFGLDALAVDEGHIFNLAI